MRGAARSCPSVRRGSLVSVVTALDHAAKARSRFSLRSPLVSAWVRCCSRALIFASCSGCRSSRKGGAIRMGPGPPPASPLSETRLNASRRP